MYPGIVAIFKHDGVTLNNDDLLEAINWKTSKSIAVSFELQKNEQRARLQASIAQIFEARRL
jgi:hypothetical protein